MMHSVRPTTWRLPEGHERVAAFATKQEAVDHGRGLIDVEGGSWAFYISNNRGAWEVIRQPRS